MVRATTTCQRGNAGLRTTSQVKQGALGKPEAPFLQIPDPGSIEVQIIINPILGDACCQNVVSNEPA